ncbi:hypothetical protein LguiB_013935 [Lonicera macranthoides]
MLKCFNFLKFDKSDNSSKNWQKLISNCSKDTNLSKPSIKINLKQHLTFNVCNFVSFDRSGSLSRDVHINALRCFNNFSCSSPSTLQSIVQLFSSNTSKDGNAFK